MVVALTFLLNSPLLASQLKTETLQVWLEYVRLTEESIRNELESNIGFFVHDFQPMKEATSDRQALLSGQVKVSRMRTEDSQGRSIKVQGGAIYHWRGSILIPEFHLDDVIERIRHPDPKQPLQEDVLESRLLDQSDEGLKIYIKLFKKKIVTVAYNTEHLVRYRWHGKSRASNYTIATKIAELDKPLTPHEREKDPGHDRGFLWKLNSYWK